MSDCVNLHVKVLWEVLNVEAEKFTHVSDVTVPGGGWILRRRNQK